jgi:hypothetical protein
MYSTILGNLDKTFPMRVYVHIVEVNPTLLGAKAQLWLQMRRRTDVDNGTKGCINLHQLYFSCRKICISSDAVAKVKLQNTHLTTGLFGEALE